MSWQARTGPERAVVDQVVLVPDPPAFLEAIAQWDDERFWPVLIEDPELTLKFLRAFRPARVVRWALPSQPIADSDRWRRVLEAVGRAWVGEDDARHPIPSGDRVPNWVHPGPPGVVVSSPTSATLAGAAALAAGRYQPLLRWEPEARYHDLISQTDAARLVDDLETRIGARIPRFKGLGDDCDFITLAGDWPYRYDTPRGANVFDDLLGRNELSQERRAYTGRLVGSPAASVYMAMCSLFLQPHSAVLFNGLDTRRGLWSLYRFLGAETKLRALLDVERVDDDSATLSGWHQLFRPANRFGLVMINSSGMPGQFVVRKGWGNPADIPASVPAVVLQIHSHSATDPSDPDTIAGRWLAQGAFAYFGAVNEPYLQAFRTPSLVGSELAEGLPVSVAVRQSAIEPFGQPWRMIYIGDPLFHLESGRSLDHRRSPGLVPAGTIELSLGPAPSLSALDETRLGWAQQSAIVETTQESTPTLARDRLRVLLSIRRERLPRASLVAYDSLLADFLDRPEHREQVFDRATQIPLGSQTSLLRRRLEFARSNALQRAIDSDDLAGAYRLWDALMRSDPAPELRRQVTDRVASMVNSPARLLLWRNQLRETLQAVRSEPAAIQVEQELKRVEERLGL